MFVVASQEPLVMSKEDIRQYFMDIGSVLRRYTITRKGTADNFRGMVDWYLCLRFCISGGNRAGARYGQYLVMPGRLTPKLNQLFPGLIYACANESAVVQEDNRRAVVSLLRDWMQSMFVISEDDPDSFAPVYVQLVEWRVVTSSTS